jgi:hypothetical protein
MPNRPHPEPLRLAERDVGAFELLTPAAAGHGRSDSGGRAQRDPHALAAVAADRGRRPQESEDLRHPRLRLPTRIRQEHQEFVSGQPARIAVGTAGLRESGGQYGEQRVARSMAPCVVDLLEPVDVQQHQCHGPSGGVLRLEAVGVRRRVRQTGGRIVLGGPSIGGEPLPHAAHARPHDAQPYGDAAERGRNQVQHQRTPEAAQACGHGASARPSGSSSPVSSKLTAGERSMNGARVRVMSITAWTSR